jgi:hypothetical protein
VLNSFDEYIKSFESMESFIKSELAGDSKANQKMIFTEKTENKEETTSRKKY